jgi:hypothetical protein
MFMEWLGAASDVEYQFNTATMQYLEFVSVALIIVIFPDISG